jgi:hypothetical protein
MSILDMWPLFGGCPQQPPGSLSSVRQLFAALGARRRRTRAAFNDFAGSRIQSLQLLSYTGGPSMPHPRKGGPNQGVAMRLAGRLFTLALALAFVAPALAAAGQAESATAFYQSYRAALAKAQKMEELLPMLSATRRAQVEKTPADDRKMMFELVKGMTADQGEVKVVKETATAKGADLAVESKSGSGTVNLVKEGGSWKVDKESWKGKM